MNRRIRFVASLFAACTAPAFAQGVATTLPPVAVTRFVADCAFPRLPSQRQVGEWTGLHNLGQVYAARERLMSAVGRACRRPGVSRVQVITRSNPSRAERMVAVVGKLR